METPTRSSNPPTETGIVDTTTPLLNRDDENNSNNARRFSRRPSLRGAAWFLRRASSRRMLREPSMLVRETAAEHLEERQSDWAYSRPVVFLDIVWNLAFVVVAVTVLVLSRTENPSMPLRLWILGYGLQCVLHMVFVCMEYRRRHWGTGSEGRNDSNGDVNSGNGSNGNLNNGNHSNDGNGNLGSSSPQVAVETEGNQADGNNTSVAKHLESANTMFSFIWWIIGFYWVSAGGQDLTRDSPQLYWLCIVFLAFDVFFVVFCVALACVIGIAVCCCLPCIIAILYAVAEQEGATKEDIDQLPKYKFCKVEDSEKLNGEAQGTLGGIMTECNTDTPMDRPLPPEDAECCICISDYDDGDELRELPCMHHFHCMCIDKWLHMNATCPLCKYNILKSGSIGREEV